MAKGAYIGVSGVARKAKKMYIGVGGVARKVKKAYIGVNGVARLWWSGAADPVTLMVRYNSNSTAQMWKSTQNPPVAFSAINPPSWGTLQWDTRLFFDSRSRRFYAYMRDHRYLGILPEDGTTWTVVLAASDGIQFLIPDDYSSNKYTLVGYARSSSSSFWATRVTVDANYNVTIDRAVTGSGASPNFIYMNGNYIRLTVTSNYYVVLEYFPCSQGDFATLDHRWTSTSFQANSGTYYTVEGRFEGAIRYNYNLRYVSGTYYLVYASTDSSGYVYYRVYTTTSLSGSWTLKYTGYTKGGAQHFPVYMDDDYCYIIPMTTTSGSTMSANKIYYFNYRTSSGSTTISPSAGSNFPFNGTYYTPFSYVQYDPETSRFYCAAKFNSDTRYRIYYAPGVNSTWTAIDYTGPNTTDASCRAFAMNINDTFCKNS